MLKIKDKQTTPQHGWSFKDDDGTTIEGGDFGELVQRVLDHRIKLGMPTDNLYAIVEDGVCRQKPIKCAPPRPDQIESERSIGVSDIWRFVKTMVDWLKERELVPQEEANRRAEICAGCKFNGDITDGSCWGCTNIMGLALQVIAERKTRTEHALKNCRVCACYNSIQVWAPLDVLQRASGDLEYPEETAGTGSPACWKRKSNPVQ